MQIQFVHNQDLLYSRQMQRQTQDFPTIKALNIQHTEAHVPHVEDSPTCSEPLQTGVEAGDLEDVPGLGDPVDAAEDAEVQGGAAHPRPARRDEEAPDQSGQIQRGRLRQEDRRELQQGKLESSGR